MTRLAIMLAVGLAGPVLADETRQLSSHVHGVSTLTIAAEGDDLLMTLAAPGADIVGFEHPASSDADRDLIRAALEDLSNPLELFALPPAAGCRVTAAEVVLVGDLGFADDHDHDHDHDHGAHDHDGDGHTEFTAEYRLTCADLRAIDRLEVGYFDLFDQAQEVSVQVAGRRGARAFEAARGGGALDLGGMF